MMRQFESPAPRGGGCRLAMLLGVLAVAFLAGAGFLLYLRIAPSEGGRYNRLVAWLNDPAGHAGWAVQAGQRCEEAPFLLPTSGYIGFLWDDSFQVGHRHQGLDIFGGNEVGATPVVAAYPGFLTRLPEWKSAVIVRLPNDPLHPGRQIWNYYTHMADSSGASFIVPDFPPGTHEMPVEAGTLLGYQGNFSGDPGNPVGTHLHFSIVLDDGQGKFRNELEIQNTLDPSPYLGLPLNARENSDTVPVCPVDE